MRNRVTAFLLAALLCVGIGGGPLAVSVSAADDENRRITDEMKHPGYNYLGTVRIKEGETIDLMPYVAYRDTYNERYLIGSIKWSTLLPSVATVDKNGVATGVKPGSTRITAIGTNNIGQQMEQTIMLRVDDPDTPARTKVVKTVSDAKFEMYVHQTVNFSELVPASKVKWSVKNTRVATVDKDGTVEAVGNGKTIITATYKDSSGNEQSMTVDLKVTGDIEFSHSRNDTITVKKGETLDLLEMFYPTLRNVSKNQLGQYLEASSTDNKVVKVEGYTITAKTKGTCTVTLEYDEDFTSTGFRGNEIIKIRVVD